jgi:intracellular septation protein
MATALRQLLEDFLSALAFLVAYALTGSLLIATSIAIGIALLQLGRAMVRKKPLSSMQWLALALAIALGSVSLLTHDSRFIRLKPTIVHWAIGFVMLKPGWQVPYFPQLVRDWVPPRTLLVWGYAWAALMFVMGLANAGAAQWLAIGPWGVFLTGLLVGKLLFFFAQYGHMRWTVIRAMRSGISASSQPSGPLPGP